MTRASDETEKAHQTGAAIHQKSSEGMPPPGDSDVAPPEWTRLISHDEWNVYQSAISALRAAGVRPLLGGAFGSAAYTGRWRNTKDMDFYVAPEESELAIRALTAAGFADYHETLAYDRGWIYRALRDGMLVDLIWGTPNRRTQVDAQWFEHAGKLLIRDELLEVVPAEELIWIKLYIVQRDRCDWPDVVNLLDATSAALRWERIVERLNDDLPLLHGALTLFAWLCPNRVGDIPPKLRRQFGIRKTKSSVAGPDLRRINLLDTRPWFAGLQPRDKPMQL